MKALLFDLDGTLVDSIPLWIEANLAELAKRNFTMNPQTFIAEIYQKGLHYHGILEKCGISMDRAQEFYDNRNKLFDELLRTKIEWLGEAGTTLQECTARLPLGLMTGSTRHSIEAMDQRLHLSKIFREMITFDDTGFTMKPDPYGLLLLIERLGIDPTECMYVGDQLVDVRASKAAGMRSCLIQTKNTPAEATEEADIVIQRIEEVLTII